MATLRRIHRTPGHWDAQVEQTIWARSRSGKPKRRRLDRPLLTHEPGWDWDGTQILHSKLSVASSLDESDEFACEGQEQLREDACPIPSGRAQATLSLPDIAQYQVAKRRNKARLGMDDFEVIRIPKVVPVSEEVRDVGDGWKLGDWEKLDAQDFRRTYSEVARGFLDGDDPPNIPGCSRLALGRTEDDSWVCI